MGPTPNENEVDLDLINAGKKPVTILPGGSFCHHADSFSMIRGGHIDYCVLGAMEISITGDLANWSTGKGIPAVGGAMDLVAGAKNVFVMTQHLTKEGKPKLVEKCSFPLTGANVVSRVYSDYAVLDITKKGFKILELNEEITFDKIYEVIYRTFDTIAMSKEIDLNTIYEIDNQTRIEAEKVVKSIS